MKSRFGALVRRGALAIFLVGALPLAASGQVAVITNHDSPVVDLSHQELRRIFRAETTSTTAGPILLVEHSAVRANFYSLVLEMAEAQVDRYWIGLVFRGDARLPLKLDSPSAVRDFVAANPGAIAFLALELVDDSVRVVAVNGRAPTDSDYLVRS